MCPAVDLSIDGRRAFAFTGHHEFDPEKESVAFIHGVGQDHTVWVLPARYFDRHDRNVIAVDLPGRGRSDGPPLESVEAMADWVIRVLDERSVRRAAVVGHSMGSLVALDLAARHADRVRSMAMVGVSVPLRVSEPLMEAAETGSHDALEMLTYWGHSKGAAVGGNETPGIWMTGAYMRLLERAPSETIGADLRACHAYDAGLSSADALDVPALVMMGARDVMTPVAGAEKLLEHLPSADTVIFEGAGHALLTERPDQVLDQLIRIV